MRKKITVPIYDQKVTFVDSTEEARKVCKPKTAYDKEWFDDSEEFSAGFTIVTEEGDIVVCAEDFLTAIHELSHATFAILFGRGFNIDWDNQEAFCYLQGWLVQQWMEKMV